MGEADGSHRGVNRGDPDLDPVHCLKGIGAITEASIWICLCVYAQPIQIDPEFSLLGPWFGHHVARFSVHSQYAIHRRFTDGEERPRRPVGCIGGLLVVRNDALAEISADPRRGHFQL
jgi:hypothetical protein